MRHPLVDPMESYELFRELECYAAAENDETRRRNAEQARKVQAAQRRHR